MNLVNTNSFEYKYERLESEELIKIVHNSRNFQPLAVETAYIELQRRTLSADITKQLNDDFNLYLKRKVAQQTLELSQPKPAQLKRAPVKQEFFTAIRTINTVSLTVLAIYFITLIEGDTSVLHMVVDPSSYRPSFFFIVVPYLMLPLGAICFGLRLKSGWIMLAWAMMYNFLKEALLLKADIKLTLHSDYSDTVSADTLIRNGIVIGFYLLIIVVICLPAIRAKMNITVPIVVFTLIAAIAFLALHALKVI